MVENAPRFYEVARQIIELTEDKILVGHNVAFDYGFIRNEFRNLGYEFRREKLCTVKLSRKLIPMRKSYSLTKLCKDLNIQNPQRHRAAGDAFATMKVFEFLLSIEPAVTSIPLRGINSNLSKEKIRNLPENPGVYYFYNNQKDIIYIGKSINIRERVLSHLSCNDSKKEIEMRDQIEDVSYELTGSEIIALLLESNEIKKHKPLFNRSQRRSVFMNGLFAYYDKDGYLRLKIDRNNEKELPLTTFTSKVAAKEFLFNLVEKHSLCQKLAGLYKTDHACFHYHINQCLGACLKKETPESYNIRVEEAIKPYRFVNNSFIIIDHGRYPDEHSVVVVEKGRYLGHGFINSNQSFSNPADFKDNIVCYEDNRDVQQIIRSYVGKKKYQKIVIY
jgi:DNA polymerase-3 subunit epsilon